MRLQFELTMLEYLAVWVREKRSRLLDSGGVLFEQSWRHGAPMSRLLFVIASDKDVELLLWDNGAAEFNHGNFGNSVFEHHDLISVDDLQGLLERFMEVSISGAKLRRSDRPNNDLWSPLSYMDDWVFSNLTRLRELGEVTFRQDWREFSTATLVVNTTASDNFKLTVRSNGTADMSLGGESTLSSEILDASSDLTILFNSFLDSIN